MRGSVVVLLCAVLAGCGGGGLEAPPGSAHARFIDARGDEVGRAVLIPQRDGVLVRAELHGLPPGTHGFHLHAIGRCDAPQFESAGGHFNPFNREHGFFDPQGWHLGDLPNVEVPVAGSVRVEALAPGVSLTTGPSALLDSDGAALVVHQNADDYATSPAGNAGPRIACAVIQR